MPRRGSEEEKSHHLLLFCQNFSTDLQDLLWRFESYLGRATTSNSLLALLTISLGASLPPSPKTCQKIPSQSRQPPHAIIFWVVVRSTQVTIHHIVTSKNFTSQPTKPHQNPYSQSSENATEVAALSLSSGNIPVKPQPSTTVTDHRTTMVLPPSRD